MTSERRPYAERIVQDPAVMVGKPVITGTRIPVERIIAHPAHKPDLADLFAAYPELTVEDVQAALAYAHDTLARDRGRTGRKQPTSAPLPV